MSRGIVDATSHARHRTSRRVLEDSDGSNINSTDLETRMTALELQVQSTSGTTEPGKLRREEKQVKRNQVRDKEGNRHGLKSNRAVSREEQTRESELLQKISQLEKAISSQASHRK